MLIALLAIAVGLVILVWSADRFVDGAAVTARHFNIPPLIIGMVIIGFGTSAPEMVVSALASWQGNPGIALGNAYGSNITNIALILGITALISPILVDSQVLRRTLPILSLVTLLAAWQLFDDFISRADALVLLGVFAGIMIWTVVQGQRDQRAASHDPLGVEINVELESKTLPLRKAVMWTVVGLLLLIVSSRILVWGAVNIAQGLGVSDLIIGLTVIAVGTSLPELASSVIAARKGEHDMALGNILGSNMFNTLAVVGIAGVIHPMGVGHEVLSRDMTVMVGLTLSLFVIGYGFRGQGRINRLEGLLLVSAYVAYTGWLIYSVFMPA
ncbi:calcium/sodium antiporter [Pseudohongiella sp.]|uniref:Sodium/calcium exchanger membrane region domain-containing protein n=1 Tax=marine sediment metagenome TaxID=412755 RepID=A0A0F9W445_9ZZZZ|nr:calcium/sodium antiporter [Pseudohongiella sp.]HDZ10214.1 calcium/sodium antiporter [Pseudohongiella sp.]HEA63968.1 calcium/sodium antiporter [Pseudohongiella sp.]